MKKVLIITYYWPPAGGPGVQRWLKFVKYLRGFEVEPVVYVPENPSYPIIDETFVKEIPEGIRIIKKKIFEPYAIAGIFSKKDTETISSGIIQKEEKQSSLQKAMLYIRGNFFIPDARKFWIKPSVKFLKDEIERGAYDAIITTGPPHSLHLIGLQLKEDLNIKWIADFRDPWTQIGYHDKLKLSEGSRRKHEELEKRVLNSADHIITTSFTTQEEFYAKTSKPITVITNGYDSEIEYKNSFNSKFKIAHIGSLLSGRNPETLWKALQQLKQEHEDFDKLFELELAGKVSEEVLRSIKNYGLEENLNNKGYISHSKALQMQRDASVLLLIEIDSQETRGIIPGKLFEYLASGRPILAIGPDKWDAEKIISKTEAGKVYSYQDITEIKTYILSLFQKYMNKEDMVFSHDLDQYHRKSLTGKLANLIKQV
ncbi:glycosyltransferase family 4 protein [Christiangramia echinicola]|uniref:Glycosyltransferase involved in cell wall bisynthesis n=1 Tax=Christiangramia echinicola TaxID=279359 RepID=A0A1H1R935_9FLAO|nr:glycosyltransferase family 4 protein [Christiangramia echinicola]SDS32272.1 Glycosyltransferase involved in cell wall bisynthesis [Christiangramia echinicola]